MKALFVTFCIASLIFPTILSQSIPPAVLDIFVSCGLETGASEADIKAIRDGNFSAVHNLLGCFADCVSKKVGIIVDDKFQPEVFKQRMATYVRDERLEHYAEECLPKAGTEECKISGKVHGCLIAHIIGNVFT